MSNREVSGKGPPKRGQEPEEKVVWPPPLAPRRGLFIVVAILLVALFAGMVELYVKIVYPNRNAPQAVERDLPR